MTFHFSKKRLKMKSVSVYSYGTSEHALGHLRICAPLERGGIQVRWYRPTDDFLPDQISNSDLVIIQRDFPRDWARYLEIIQHANKYQKPIVFELDDLLWDLPSDHPDRINNHYLKALWPMLLAAIQADAIVVATPELQSTMQSFHTKVYLLPNYFDDQLWKFRKPVHQEEGVVRIGYMGGDSHRQDVEMILPALKEILQRFASKVRLIFWGLEPPDEMRFLPNVEWHPINLQDYAQFADYFLHQEMEIFLAPLRLLKFNQSKSPIKYFECSSLGGVGVCSDITPYQQVIAHGETGYLAGSIDAWIEHLTELIENPQLRVQISQQAQTHIRRNWLLSTHYQQWAETYQEVIDHYQPREQMEIFRVAADIQEQWSLAELAERNVNNNQVAALENQLDSIYSGRSWKFLQYVRKLRNLYSRDSK